MRYLLIAVLLLLSGCAVTSPSKEKCVTRTIITSDNRGAFIAEYSWEK